MRNECVKHNLYIKVYSLQLYITKDMIGDYHHENGKAVHEQVNMPHFPHLNREQWCLCASGSVWAGKLLAAGEGSSH